MSQLIGKDPDAGKDWRQKEKRASEDEVVGWHHQLNGLEFKQTPGDRIGKPGMLQSMGSKGIGHDWVTEQRPPGYIMLGLRERDEEGVWGAWMTSEGFISFPPWTSRPCCLPVFSKGWAPFPPLLPKTLEPTFHYSLVTASVEFATQTVPLTLIFLPGMWTSSTLRMSSYLQFVHRSSKVSLRTQPLQVTPDTWSHLHDWTYKCTLAPLKAHDLKVVCRGLKRYKISEWEWVFP